MHESAQLQPQSEFCATNDANGGENQKWDGVVKQPGDRIKPCKGHDVDGQDAHLYKVA